MCKTAAFKVSLFNLFALLVIIDR